MTKAGVRGATVQDEKMKEAEDCDKAVSEGQKRQKEEEEEPKEVDLAG
jgi:hypothetical protein